MDQEPGYCCIPAVFTYTREGPRRIAGQYYASSIESSLARMAPFLGTITQLEYPEMRLRARKWI